MAYPALALFLLWLLWASAFIGQRLRNLGQPVAVKARSARLGIALQAVGFAVLFAHGPQGRAAWLEVPAWRIAPEILFGAIAATLSWSAVPTLGKQWRYEAALIDGHQLIQSGPYAIIRHPIYTSMLAILIASAFALGTAWRSAIALALGVAGTEIRVRAEERLLAARFGPEFDSYRARVPAYLPLVR